MAEVITGSEARLLATAVLRSKVANPRHQRVAAPRGAQVRGALGKG